MTFYIPPFWCGVIATVVFEFVSLIVAAIAMSVGDKKKKGEKDVKEEVDGIVDTYDDRGEWNDSQRGGN